MAKSAGPTENLVYHEAEFTSDDWNIPYPKSKIQSPKHPNESTAVSKYRIKNWLPYAISKRCDTYSPYPIVRNVMQIIHTQFPKVKSPCSFGVPASHILKNHDASRTPEKIPKDESSNFGYFLDNSPAWLMLTMR